ncbi:MAG: lipopolysaccharide biosynthesis protein [Solirubrobacteraceae bacterium]
MSAAQPDVGSSATAVQAEPEPLTRRAVRSFAWSTIAFGGNKLLVFLSTVVLARLLVPGDFGIVADAMAVLVFFDVVLDLGVGAALIYEQERGITARVQTAFTLNLIVSLTLAGIGVLLTPAIAAFFGLSSHQDVFRALFAYLLVRGVGQVQDSVLQRDLRFGRRATVEVARGGVRLAASVALAVMGFGVWALVGGLLAGELTATTLSWWLVDFWPRLSLDRAALRVMMGFGLTFIMLKVVDAISIDSDYLVVGHRLGATQQGFYSMGYRLPELALMSLYWIVGAVAFPVYSAARTRGRDASIRAMLRALRMITLFSFPAGILLALLSRDVITVLFGAKWSPAIQPMMLISLMTAVTSIGFASGDLFPANGRPGTLLAMNVPLAMMLLTGYILAAPYGIVAVAAVHLGLAIPYQAARMLLVNRLLGTTLPQTLGAMRPALYASLGVLALALPLRLAMPHGVAALLLVGAAGVGGALAGMLLGARDTALEVRGLLMSIRPRHA